MDVRVRFAPSPTGYLHVGGLRTALYNYLFARHHGGKCILRIEDTDRTRFVENAQENLIEGLTWAGITFDEGPHVGGAFGPYVQSERFHLYKDYGKRLLENGAAYYAFDTAEELDAMRERQQKAGIAPKYDRTVMRNQYTLGLDEAKRLVEEGAEYVVRLKVPATAVVRFRDVIRGEVVVQGKDVDDQILLKSDGFPTYHLANVVDDHLMKITHVIRGEEWLPSTPKHVLLYEAFGWETPQFAHLPLLLNQNKAKLSKRQGDVAVEDFRAKGYLREAFVNFIALLGWNPTSDREIFSMEELIETFTLEKVNKSGAVFDVKKLDWMNAQYLRSTPPERLAGDLANLLNENGMPSFDMEYLKKVVILLLERVTFVRDIPGFGSYMFGKPTQYEEEYIRKRWKEDTLQLIEPLIEKFKTLDEWTHDSLHDATKARAEEAGAKLGDAIHPLRIMITGKSVGAGMFETMEVLGKEECLERIQYFLDNKVYEKPFTR